MLDMEDVTKELMASGLNEEVQLMKKKIQLSGKPMQQCKSKYASQYIASFHTLTNHWMKEEQRINTPDNLI